MTQTILVVDDDRHLRQTIALTLVDAGYRVREAGDGLRALQMLQAAPPDLILSDVTMPYFDGIRLKEQIRRLPNAAPVILMSAGNAAAGGSSAPFLGKPFELETLLDLVSRVLGNAPQRGSSGNPRPVDGTPPRLPPPGIPNGQDDV